MLVIFFIQAPKKKKKRKNKVADHYLEKKKLEDTWPVLYVYELFFAKDNHACIFEFRGHILYPLTLSTWFIHILVEMVDLLYYFIVFF